jgi:hypothetical protein
MISTLRKTEKMKNEYMTVELKKAETLAYWQTFMNRPK